MRMPRILAACLLLLGLPVMLAAQVDRATLTGVVRDPSNAVVPGAAVAITNSDTGVRRATTTSSDGAFLVVDLASGEYLVETSAAGF